MMTGQGDTGYEGRYDFAGQAGPPRLFYLLATVPRSGSTYLSHLLWRTGCLGAPLEYLNFDPAGPYGFASGSPAEQLRLWRSVLRRRTSPNGVFGVKCFPPQLQALRGNNPALLAEVRPRRVIHLARRDRVAHAVSLARASISGVWRHEQETAANRTVEFSSEAIRQAQEGIDHQQRVWEGFFANAGIEPLRLWHEDAVARPDETVGQVAEFLGVTLDAAARIDVPEVKEQHRGDALRWIGRVRAGG